MKKTQKLKNSKAFSIIEVIIALGIFAIFATGIAGVVATGFTGGRQGEEQTKATQFASEGLEAVRSIRNQAFANLTATGSAGITATSAGVWKFSGINNTFEKYSRTLAVNSVERDGSGNIVASGGTVDANTWKATSSVSWAASGARNDSVVLSTYLSNFQTKIARGGVLVFGDGSLTSDAIKFQTIDSNGTWSVAASTADVDGSSSNRVLRAVRIYASPTRNEKVMISRHYNGTVQYIYGQVYNGTTWGNVQLLSSFTAGTFLDVQNFDGTYQNNGNFVVVYSDNTVIPKMVTWNGASWSGSSSLTTLGAGNIPNYIVLKARPGTNEMMAAFFTQNSSAISEYYSGSVWSAITSHANAAPVNTKRLIDFDWSPNSSVTGGLIYVTATNGSGSRSMTIKIWTANGSGSGSWSAAATTGTQGNGSTRLSTMTIVGRPGTNEFEACDVDTQQSLICYTSTFTPTWSNPTNQTLTATTQAGIQRPFHLGYETISGTTAVSVFSDNTTTPKLKKYTTSTTTWDAANTSLPVLSGILNTVRLIPSPISDDMMIFLGDANANLNSILWDGTNATLVGTAVGDSAIETNVDSNTAGQAESFATTANVSQTINSISMFLDTGNAATNVTVGLYSNNAGHPGTLLTQGSSSSLMTDSWNSIALAPVDITNGTSYWISLLGTGGVIRFRDRTAGGCNSETSSQTNLVTLPASWTTGSTFGTCPVSEFAPISGYSLTGHGINGSAATDYWYDFTWDNF